jgi:hypothetical protein
MNSRAGGDCFPIFSQAGANDKLSLLMKVFLRASEHHQPGLWQGAHRPCGVRGPCRLCVARGASPRIPVKFQGRPGGGSADCVKMANRLRLGVGLPIQTLFSSLQFFGFWPINKEQYAMALNPWIQNRKMRLILRPEALNQTVVFFIS